MKIDMPNKKEAPGKEQGIHLFAKALGKGALHVMESGSKTPFPLVMAEQAASATISPPPPGETGEKTAPATAAAFSGIGMGQPSPAVGEMSGEEGIGETMGSPLEEALFNTMKEFHAAESSRSLPAEAPSLALQWSETAVLKVAPPLGGPSEKRSSGWTERMDPAVDERVDPSGFVAVLRLGGPPRGPLTAEKNLPDPLNRIGGKHGQRVSASVLPERASISDEAGKPLFLGVDEKKAATRPVAPGQTASAGFPATVAFARYARGANGPVHQDPQAKNATTALQTGRPGGESSPLHPQATPLPADQKNHPPVSGQAVSAEFPATVAFARYARGANGPVHQDPQAKNATAALQTRKPEGELSPLRPQATPLPADQKNHPPVSGQAVSADFPATVAFARYTRGANGPVHQDPQAKNATAALQTGKPEGELSPLRPQATPLPAVRKTHSSGSVDPAPFDAVLGRPVQNMGRWIAGKGSPDLRGGAAGKQGQGVPASVLPEAASVIGEASKALSSEVEDADPNATTDLQTGQPGEGPSPLRLKAAPRPADPKTVAPASDDSQPFHPALHRPAQKGGRLAAGKNPPDLRDGAAWKPGQGVSASVMPERASITGEIRKTSFPGVDDAEAATGPVESSQTGSAEFPEKGAFARSFRAAAGPLHGESQGQHVAADLQGRMSGQESFPVSMEAGTRVAHLKNHAPASDGFDAFHTQAAIDQILEAQKAMNGDLRRVRIVLDPPNLGTLNLDILLRRKRMEIVMTADNIGLQQALQSRAEDIRTALQRQDFRVEGFQVLLQDNAASQQQGRGEAMFEKHDEDQNGRRRTKAPPVILPASVPFERAGQSIGIVSIFV